MVSDTFMSTISMWFTMLSYCQKLSRLRKMCKYMSNAGLRPPPLENVEGVFSNIRLYAKNQLAVDVIFNNRMKQYECLTTDSSMAVAVFVPFCAGFDIARYLWGCNMSVRDAALLDLVDWLMRQLSGEFWVGRLIRVLIGGTWFLFLHAVKNMLMLVVESSPWNANEFRIPNPTYFHPTKDSDVFV